MKLEYQEPTETCEVEVGQFTFINTQGVEESDPFYVRCEGESQDPAVTARNMEAYNTQLTDEWIKLEALGCTQIKYREVTPLPIE